MVKRKGGKGTQAEQAISEDRAAQNILATAERREHGKVLTEAMEAKGYRKGWVLMPVYVTVGPDGDAVNVAMPDPKNVPARVDETGLHATYAEALGRIRRE